MKYTLRSYISIVLNIIVIVASALGVVLSMSAERDSFMGSMNALKYFTIQSNIAIGVLSLAVLIRLLLKKENNRLWSTIRLAGAISITLTGAVFCIMLAPTMGAKAWRLNNVLTHVVVPVSAVFDFFLSKEEGLGFKSAFWTMLPPLAYLIFACIGYGAGMEFSPGRNYPYFFLNWGSSAGAFGFSKDIPYMGCIWWILLLMILLFGVAELYIYLSHRVNHSKKM